MVWPKHEKVSLVAQTLFLTGALYQRVRELGQRMELTLFISQSLLKTLPMTEADEADDAATDGDDDASAQVQGERKQRQR